MMKSAKAKKEWPQEKKYGEIALKKLPRLSYSPLEEYTLYCGLANAYGHTAEYFRSVDACYKADLIASKNNFAPVRRIFVSYTIGCNFLFMRNLNQALPHYRKVKEHYEKYRDDTSAINKQVYFYALIGLGYCYLYKSDLVKAREIIEEQLSGLLPAITDKDLQQNYYHLKGEYLMALKKYAQSREAFQKSAEIIGSDNFSSPIAEIKIHLAELDILDGNIESAIKISETLLKDTQKLKLNRLFCEAGLLLSKSYSLNKMPDKAVSVERKIKPLLCKMDVTWLYEKTREYEELLRNLNQSKDNIMPTILSLTSSKYGEKPESEYTIIGNSNPMVEIFGLIEKIAPTDLPVLIQGETGTGKELIARAIHGNSERKGKPLLTLNCGAIAETLLENELFGHAKGAFTDAQGDRKGYIELASDGTLFLDEISEMSPNMQQKLLRVLEEKQIWRLGAEKPIPIDTRFIFASNKDIEEMVSGKLFRKELFYRINTIVINLPPLKDRKDDIPLLAKHFLFKYSGKTHDSQLSTYNSIELSPDALDLLIKYGWPGNVRELENEIKRICALYSNDKFIREEMLSETIRNYAPAVLPHGKNDLKLKELKKQYERNVIMETLKKCNGNITQTARQLGCLRQHLQLKIRNFKIEISNFVTKR